MPNFHPHNIGKTPINQLTYFLLNQVLITSKSCIYNYTYSTQRKTTPQEGCHDQDKQYSLSRINSAISASFSTVTLLPVRLVSKYASMSDSAISAKISAYQ